MLRREMKLYQDIQGDSGISAYECGDDWIDVQFKGGDTYRYLAVDIGSAAVHEMKRLAQAGDGLNAFINTHPSVKEGYSDKW